MFKTAGRNLHFVIFKSIIFNDEIQNESNQNTKTMKKTFLVLLLVAASGLLCAQTPVIQVKRAGSDFWKYADLKGNLIIDKEYPLADAFSTEGIAIVAYPKKNNYHLINLKGQEIETEIKDFYLKNVLGFGIQGFTDGLLPVSVEKKWGCLNTSGKLVIPLKYDNVSYFDNGYGVSHIENNFFVLNRKGKETPVKIADLKDVKRFSENLAPYVTLAGLQGFIDTTAAIVIPAKFMDVGDFCGGLAFAKNIDGLIGYINHKGEWVIEPQFKSAKDFDPVGGIARVNKGEAWMYVNKKGETFAFNISDTYEDFAEGLCKGKSAALFGFFNTKGEWVIKPQFEGVRDFKNGYAAAKSNRLWGIINPKGEWVIKPTFTAIKDVEFVK